MIEGLNITIMEKDPMYCAALDYRFYWRLYSGTQCIAISYKAWADEKGARQSARGLARGQYNPIRVNKKVRKDPSPHRH